MATPMLPHWCWLVGLVILGMAAGALLAAATAFSGGPVVVLYTGTAAAIALAAMIVVRCSRVPSASESRSDSTPLPISGREARRLEMLGSLAAGLAHELGQPLSAARVGIEGIHYLKQLGREPDSGYLDRTLTRVGMNLLAMTQTIDHLRGLARPERIVTEAVDLVALVDGLLAERDQWLRFHDTRIEWMPSDAPVLGHGEPAGLRLIVTNLLRNAVEAVAAQSQERRLVRITVGPGPRLTVRDSGPGIAPDHLAHLFDPFRTTKEGPGRGIGLSLAQASAERMRATLQVQSQIGAGTTFTLSLQPLDASESP